MFISNPYHFSRNDLLKFSRTFSTLAGIRSLNKIILFTLKCKKKERKHFAHFNHNVLFTQMHLIISLQLSFPGVKIVNAYVKAKKTNVVTTFMRDDHLDLSHGIEFNTTHKVLVRKRIVSTHNFIFILLQI